MTRNPSHPKGFTHVYVQVFSTYSWSVTAPTMALTVERVTFPVGQPKWIIDNRFFLQRSHTMYTCREAEIAWWSAQITTPIKRYQQPSYSSNCDCCSGKINSFRPYIHFKCAVHKATFKQPAQSVHQPKNTSAFSVCVSVCVCFCVCVSVSILGSWCLRQIKACWLSQKAVFTLLTEAVCCITDCFPHVLSTPKTG